MKEGNSQPIQKPKTPSHWADQYAEQVIREKGEKEIYTCASGITPSGTVHIGNFREIISVDLVVRALRKRGKKVRFIYFWDDFDVFRKVPKNMPNPEILERYLHFPIDLVPDTTGLSDSYARFNELDVENTLPILGIYPTYIYQSKQYRSHTYAKKIQLSLERKEEIRYALNEYRTEPLPKDWMPVIMFCEKCTRDTTRIISWDGEWKINYECFSCREEKSTDLRSTELAKLPWRLDWPMRWSYENVDFEPAGKDHHSQGGSFDTSRLVVKTYGGESPVTFQYDFLSIKGRGGKISSSSGEVVSISDVLEVYTPDITRYLFASTRPNVEFSISFDLDVLKVYEDYDKTQRIYYGVQPAKNEKEAEKQKRIYELSQPHFPEPEMPYDISFRHLTTLSQIFEGNSNRVISELGNVKPSQRKRLLNRIDCAFHWVRNFSPEEFRFSLRTSVRPNLNKDEEKAVSKLVSYLKSNMSNLEEKILSNEIYSISRLTGLEPMDFFKTIYRLLIAKKQGPRLAHFIVTLSAEKTIRLLTT